MKKVAIYGGSFNPIGKHHIEIANRLSTIVDEVWITPCYKSITGKQMESAEDRTNMCKLAMEKNNNSKIKFCNFEIENELFDESVNIIRKFLNCHKEDNIQYYFLIGTDNALTIDTWLRWEEMINSMPFIVIPRNGY